MSRAAKAKPVSAQKTEGRNDIMEAAAEAIAEHGFHGMSMRDLAKATGKGLASLYNYFDSKEDLLFALQAGAFEALVESANEAMVGSTDTAARLYALVLNHVRYVAEHPNVMRVLVHEASALPPAQRKRVRQLKEAYYALCEPLVRALLLEGCKRPGASGTLRVDQAEVERATYSVFGTLNWVYTWYQPARHGPPHEVARTIHRMVLCGLVAACPMRVDLTALERRLKSSPTSSPIRSTVMEGE